jgi:hypothetical protein
LVDAFAFPGESLCPQSYLSTESAFAKDRSAQRHWVHPTENLVEQCVNHLFIRPMKCTNVTPFLKDEAWFKKLMKIQDSDAVNVHVTAETMICKSNDESSTEPLRDRVLVWSVDSGIQIPNELLKVKTLSECYYFVYPKENVRIEIHIPKTVKYVNIIEMVEPFLKPEVPIYLRKLCMKRAHLQGHFGAEAMFKS